ncbi:MAG: MFS transporter [Nostocaceae cyanobacterium]|nr:MFS transporter [Nostocaceae cyanobacterium]
MEVRIMNDMGSFIPIWFGKFISTVGSSITGFALGIWIYQHTESVTDLALTTLSTTLPSVILSPVLGTLVDRFDKRWVLFMSDLGSGLCTGALGILFVTGNLEIWHIYLIRSVNSICVGCQVPAYTTAITLLVPKEQLTRANGLVQLGSSIAQLISPLLGGILIATIEIRGIILTDLATFVFSLIILFFIQFPEYQTTTSKSILKETSIFSEIAFAWNYIQTKPGILGLIMLFGMINFLFAFVGVLTVPLVMSFTSATVMGLLMSIGGSGTLLGSLALTIWGESVSNINYLFLSMLLSGLCILVVGLQAKVWLIAIAGFFFFFATPIISSSIQVMLQKKVQIDVQGRVFAFSGTICGVLISLAYIISGPLADYVFEPLMAAGGLLSESVGQIIGVGQGRGIGLMFLVMGGVTMLFTTLAYQYPPLRLVENEPDI